MGEVVSIATREVLEIVGDYECPECGHDKFRFGSAGLRCARTKCQQPIDTDAEAVEQ